MTWCYRLATPPLGTWRVVLVGAWSWPGAARPQLIRHLYGGQSESPWTMVGTVTHTQGSYVDLQNETKSDEASTMPFARKDASGSPMMLDAYRRMFRSLRTFERMFLESDKGSEIILSPLAIYREFQLQVRDESE